ncbi:MAG: FG-GAP repeat protein [Sandaracinaceae bacterium]
MGVRAGIVALVGLLLSACVPTEFEDLRGEASTYAYDAPSGYPNSGFGERVVAYGGTLRGVSVSRVGGNAGVDSPFVVFPLLEDDSLDLETPRLDGCGNGFTCREGAGASLFGLPRWAGRELCIGIPSPTTGEIRIRCEDDITMSPPAVSGTAGEGLGEASASLAVDHPFGRALLGAPTGAGAVYRLPDGSPPVRVDLSAADGVGRGLGRAVAIAPLDADSVLIAAGAPVGGTKRVVVAVADVDAMGAVTTSVRGCLDASSEGWGASVAIGDVDGDGRLDIAVGSGTGEGRLDAVRVFSGADMPAVETCDGSWAPAVELPCPELDGIDCRARFGVTLATGDLDADGQSEILVGAPDARVDGEDAAGAVFVFGGGSLSEMGSRASALTHSTPELGANLGASIAVAPGVDGRSEPIVGAPGAERVYVFLCSAVDGDSEGTTPQTRCQPR